MKCLCIGNKENITIYQEITRVSAVVQMQVQYYYQKVRNYNRGMIVTDTVVDYESSTKEKNWNSQK